jgi:pimeloyl-ACP methyl ester carboxylesterase
MPTAELRNAKIAYEITGTGDPTVLIHGSLVDRSTWERVRTGLAPSLTVLTYDRRGHGDSSGPPRARPVRDDASDLSALLATLDLYPVHIIAHSYGGAVALRIAADHPEMVRSLALHEPPFLGLLEEDPATVPEAERLESATREMVERLRSGDREGAVREVVNSLAPEEGAWDRMGHAVQQSMLRYAYRWGEEISDPEAIRPDTGAASDLLVPVLLTTGERSPPFLLRITNHLANALRNVTVRTVVGAGHAPQVSDPDRFIALIHGFLVERSVPFT